MSTLPFLANDVPADQPQTGGCPLILLPGLGGDARMFGPQRAAFPELIVPHWIEPKPRESLSDYAARFAAVIDPGRPCFVGGASFGGVVALEVATHLAARECFLFGSVRDPRQIPRRLRLFRSTSSLVMIPKWLAPPILAVGGRWMGPVFRGNLTQLKDVDPRFLRWGADAILKWVPSSKVAGVRAVQIHGDRDKVFPIGLCSPDLIVAGAGHLVSLRHPKVVNQFVRERMLAANSEFERMN